MLAIRAAIRDPYRWLEAVLGGFLVVIAVQNTVELIRFHSLAVDIQIPPRDGWPVVIRIARRRSMPRTGRICPSCMRPTCCRWSRRSR